MLTVCFFYPIQFRLQRYRYFFEYARVKRILIANYFFCITDTKKRLPDAVAEQPINRLVVIIIQPRDLLYRYHCR